MLTTMNSSEKMEPVVSVRLVSADYYMASPIPGVDIGYSTYRGIEIKKVPVIRVFGSTSTGCKVCLHVHGVFPYLYIPYDGSAPPDKLGHQIVIALDKAINILQGQGTSSSHHIFKAVLVSGVPMYGYHAKEHQLFKVYFYNPITRKHSYDLLLNGTVLKKNFQPCEAHIPFILQFLMDFNLQGMNFIHIRKAFARRKPNYYKNLDQSKAEPVSTCEMELDCSAGDILNCLDVQGIYRWAQLCLGAYESFTMPQDKKNINTFNFAKDGVQMNPGLAALWEEEIERRKIKNINLDNINPPPSQPRPDAVPTSSHVFYKTNLSKRLHDCTAEMGNVSLSFCEVNEQLETSLAIETPEGAERTLLSASSIDFHGPGQQFKPTLIEGETELLNILCDLADEHESVASTSPTMSGPNNVDDKMVGSQNSKSSRMTVTTPLLDITSSCDSYVEDLPFDDDSVLGTQHYRASSDTLAKIGSNDLDIDSDEERETLEMSQIFDESEDGTELFQYRNNRLFPASKSLSQITEQVEEDESSSSSFANAYLPNVDGADDGNSSDDDEPQDSGKANQIRKYRPLQFRRSSKEPASKVQLDCCTSLNLRSPSSSPPRAQMIHSSHISSVQNRKIAQVNPFGSNNTQLEYSEIYRVDSRPSSPDHLETKSMTEPNNSEYSDALFAMSYLSPLPYKSLGSPPQPGTPIKDARVTVHPLLQDISAHEDLTGRKIKVYSGRVILKTLDEEIDKYQTQNHLKLRITPILSDRESFVSEERDKKRQRKSKSDTEDEINKIYQTDESQIQKEHQGDSKNVFNTRNSENEDWTMSQIEIPKTNKQLINQIHGTSKTAIIKSCKELRVIEKEIEQPAMGQEIDNEDVYTKNIENEENKMFTFNAEDKLNDKDESFYEISPYKTPHSLLFRTEINPGPSNQGSDKSSCEFLNSHSLMVQNWSPSSSSLYFTGLRDASNSIWNDDDRTSLLVDGDDITDETPITTQTNKSIVIHPQVFHPSTIYAPIVDGPSHKRVTCTLNLYNIPSAVNGIPFWGNSKDLVSMSKTKDFRRQTLPIASNLICHLQDFGSSNQQIREEISNHISCSVVLTPLASPPPRQSVMRWLEKHKTRETDCIDLAMPVVKPIKIFDKTAKNEQAGDRSQLEAPSLNNSFGFRVSFGNCLQAKAVHQNQYLTILSLELHIKTREALRPDPEFDAVIALFYTITNDVPIESTTPEILTGVIAVDPEVGSKQDKKFFKRAGIVGLDVVSVSSEVGLFQQLVQLVGTWNPDILVGYEIEMLSLGYLLQRGTVIGIPVHNLLSRIPESIPGRSATFPEEVVEGGYMVEKNSDINIPGRIVLNLWRILKVEIALQSYTFENMAFHILRRRIPTYTFKKLTCWWESNHERWQVIEHYICRARGNVELMEQLDVIGRTSELARLFGIQFYEVFTRGSQYRVESMMLRLAKPKNFIAASPSIAQRSRMKAPEWLPLILEPESKFYTDPILVLDFQSLYPSMIIAYNYCYSTCLGRTHLLGKNEPFEFGCTQLLIPPAIVQKLVKQDLVNISPAGIVYVKPEVRKGIIPQMLEEILNTRIMVKQSMKEYEGDTTLRRIFDSRQLGLKLIANVTYGYTSANFSGRMPCVEIGDSVVSKGRETLERAIHLIESCPEWKARVVYGDTDSVFVLLPGRNRQEAFEIGDQIANAVTQNNPLPVKLKFEKVYHPCILQTKKRYVGYKYESVNQKNPVYEAKGIETVRRDGCPAVVKLLERSLRLLFESYDVSKVKAYVQRQFLKILQNRNSLQDFIFAKEFRGRHGYKSGACVPALEIAKQQSRIDRRSEPRIGERVPYIVVYGSPGVPLIRLVVPAEHLLIDTSLRLNGHYYIARAIIPALQRCLGLLGADVLSWYQSLPRNSAMQPSFVGLNELIGNTRKATISHYFGSSICLLCDEPIFRNGLCAVCGSSRQRQASSLSLAAMQRLREKDYAELISLCRSCTGNVHVEQDCVSMDCPVLYRRVKAFQNLQLVSKWHEALSLL